MMRHMQGTLDPLIYIGSLRDANNIDWLKQCNVKVVFNVCNDIESEHCSDFIYLKWGLDDPKEGLAERNIVESAAVVLNMARVQARKMGGNILVHCAAGQNRSALVVALWKHIYEKWDFKDAVKAAQVKDKKNWMIDKGYNW